MRQKLSSRLGNSFIRFDLHPRLGPVDRVQARDKDLWIKASARTPKTVSGMSLDISVFVQEQVFKDLQRSLVAQDQPEPARTLPANFPVNAVCNIRECRDRLLAGWKVREMRDRLPQSGGHKVVRRLDRLAEFDQY